MKSVPTTATASPFSRACLVAYVMLIVYASLHPFSGWHFDNLAAFVEQIKQWPHYWAKFDALINILGYVPLGVLLMFALYPRISRIWSLLMTVILACALSTLMESLQFFLPTRVTSMLDIATNAGGGFLGALLGAFLLPRILESGRLKALRLQWFHPETSREIVVLGLWPLAQIYPQAFLFGLGQILPTISLWFEEYLDISIDLSSLLRNGVELSAEEYLLSEAIITACGCAGAILFLLSLLNRHAPKFTLAMLMLLSALIIKALATALMFQPESAFVWASPGARGGIVISMLMLYGFSFTPQHTQRRLAILLLTISLLMVNLIPSNPYFLNTLQTMVQGKMLNFYGAAEFLSLLWPFAGIWFLAGFSRIQIKANGGPNGH